MLRINKMTDYGMLILGNLAVSHGGYLSASDIASSTHISLPTVQKLLKKLNKNKLVVSKQGPLGGYALNEATKLTSVSKILEALEGNSSLMECSAKQSTCEIENSCQIGNAWQIISQTIFSSLDKLTLLDLIKPSEIEQYLPLEIPIHQNQKRQ